MIQWQTLNAKNLLQSDRTLHADMLAAMQEHRAKVKFDSEKTLLLQETGCGVHFLTSHNAMEAETLLRTLFEEGAVVVLHGAIPVAAARAIGFEIDPPCRQVLYEGEPLPVSGELTVRHPDDEDFPLVDATYGLSGGEHLRRDFDKPDFLGGYLDGKLVCFIGLHTEGSMGILEVLPDYRRRGFAQQIYSTLINNQLKKGRLPYAQIYTDNRNSLKLQEKLGFSFSSDTVSWSWNPKFED